MNRLLYASCLPLLLGCQPGALDNSNFNLWCGESLCSWDTEQGKIRRVSTWDANDYGVELVGKPTVISQLANLDYIGDDPCLRFSILGNVATEAEVQLELDFSDDGTVDYREGIPGVRWQRLDLLVRLPTQQYRNLKVSLDKQGDGTAVFASLAAGSAKSCDGDPIVLSNLTSGDLCADNTDCKSGHCNTGVTQFPGCGECTVDADCPTGLMCGAVNAPRETGLPFLGCVPPQATPDGDACSLDGQCAHGHCKGGVCGPCATDLDCSSDRTCGYASDAGTFNYACVLPGTLPNGSDCHSASQCASGHCCGVCDDATAFCLTPMP